MAVEKRRINSKKYFIEGQLQQDSTVLNSASVAFQVMQTSGQSRVHRQAIQIVNNENSGLYWYFKAVRPQEPWCCHQHYALPISAYLQRL